MLLTQCDLSLHRHGECWVFNLTAEQGIIVHLRVQGPRELGLHGHRTITLWEVGIAEEVGRVGTLDPMRELTAHHCLWDSLCCRTGLITCLPGCVAPSWTLSVEASKQRQWFLHFGVVQIPADQRPCPAHACWTSSFIGCRWWDIGDHFNQLTISLEIYLEKEKEKSWERSEDCSILLKLPSFRLGKSLARLDQQH